MRVVMYVLNDVTRDSRVLREAATLASAGHDVTIMAAPLAADFDGPEPPPPAGVTIRRVPIPTGSPWWVTGVRAPWRLRHPAALLLLPWMVVRGAWVGIVNRLLGRPVQAGGIDFIRRWRVEWLGWCRSAVVAAPSADVHHAHDMEALSAARAAAARDRSRYVYDSHEVYMEWGPVLRQPSFLRGIMARWERRMARGAAAVVTIGDVIAAELARRFGISGVIALYNCPPRWDPPAVPEHRIRVALGLASEVPVVLCHGGFMANRGLEETAEAMLEPGLERAHLVFLGYRAAFIEPILADRRFAGRVHHLAAVPPDDVVSWVSGADVDVVAIGTATENGRLSTPNKLFESIAAGVPVVVSDFGPMREIVLDPEFGPLGAVCDPNSPTSIGAAIKSILDLDPASRSELRARVLRAAHERWNWETESARLVALYSELASGS